LPTEIGLLFLKIRSLELRNNLIGGSPYPINNNLSGIIPSEIGNLRNSNIDSIESVDNIIYT